MKEILTDVIRYWEPRRLLYNVVLVIVSLWRVVPLVQAFHDGAIPGWVWGQLLILALEANIAYCAAYFVDIVVQHSDYREPWRRWRWVLFLLGTSVAGALAWFLAPALIAGHPVGF